MREQVEHYAVNELANEWPLLNDAIFSISEHSAMVEFYQSSNIVFRIESFMILSEVVRFALYHLTLRRIIL